MPKVSVIIPIYNVAPYLDDCLQSLAAQTMTEAEYILIDDGSTDESGAICDRWASLDSRFRVAHKENGGVSSARNLGLEMARGEYIGFADGDDWLEPDALESLCSLLESNSQADIACAGYYEYQSDPTKPPIVHPSSADAVRGYVDRETALHNILIRGGYFVSVCNKLFRRTLVHQNGAPLPFQTELHMGEDEIWLLRLMLDSRMCVFSPTPIYHWRSRSSSMTHQTSLTPKRMSVLEAKKIAISLMADISPQLEKLARSRMYNDTFDLQTFAYRADDWNALKQIRHAMKGNWLAWATSRDVRPVRKIKVVLLLIMMELHFPKKWVRKVNNYGSRQKESV